MAIYQITDDKLVPSAEITFAQIGIKERADLQRILKNQIEIISPETLVISEEFGDWEDSKRRIDLLGIDKSANLIVIELKRTEDGGHMELQAIRYAAMVSAMTFERAIEVLAHYLQSQGVEADSKETLLEFLDWEEPDEEQFAQDIRIVLASAEFSKELTTAVMWLNDRGLDISCMRLKPYRSDGMVLVDVQQVIPLPEATEYTVKIREKQKKERESRKSNMDFTKYDVTISGVVYEKESKRGLMFRIVKALFEKGATPDEIAEAIPWRKSSLFVRYEGELSSEEFVDQVMKNDPGGKIPRYKRYFYRDEELFHFKGNTYALTNQWGLGAIKAVTLLGGAFPSLEVKLNPAV